MAESSAPAPAPAPASAPARAPEKHSNRFMCPISLEVMRDPVTAADGRAYERDEIRQWLQQRREASPPAPMTNAPLAHRWIVTAHALREEMGEAGLAERLLRMPPTEAELVLHRPPAADEAPTAARDIRDAHADGLPGVEIGRPEAPLHMNRVVAAPLRTSRDAPTLVIGAQNSRVAAMIAFMRAIPGIHLQVHIPRFLCAAAAIAMAVARA